MRLRGNRRREMEEAHQSDTGRHEKGKEESGLDGIVSMTSAPYSNQIGDAKSATGNQGISFRRDALNIGKYNMCG